MKLAFWKVIVTRQSYNLGRPSGRLCHGFITTKVILEHDNRIGRYMARLTVFSERVRAARFAGGGFSSGRVNMSHPRSEYGEPVPLGAGY
jgi:hypothetical protein